MSDLRTIPVARLATRAAPLVRQGRVPQARRLLARAWDLAAERLAAAPPSGAKFLALVADFEARHERPRRAASLLRQASRRFRRLAECRDDLPSDLDALAAALEALGAGSAACGGDLAPEDRVLVDGYQRLATVNLRAGRPEKAEPFLRRVLEIRKTAVGERHVLYAWSLGELADLLIAQENLPAAREAAVRALELYRATLTVEHPGLLPGLRRLAAVCVRMGDWAAAEPLLLAMREVYRRCLGDDHSGVAQVRLDLAELYVRMEAYDLAASQYWEAIAAARPSSHRSIRILLALAHVHRLAGCPGGGHRRGSRS